MRAGRNTVPSGHSRLRSLFTVGGKQSHAQTSRQGHPAPSLVGRTLRQVSWLSGRRVSSAFPVGTSGQNGETLADDSCGGSSGFQAVDLAPDSLLIPGGGTINAPKSSRTVSSMSSQKPLHVVAPD